MHASTSSLGARLSHFPRLGLAADLLDTQFADAAIEVVAGHAGPAYGVAHAATIEAVRLAGALEALTLDPVYSGKGLAGLMALVKSGRWPKDSDVVFIHTGGAPALFAYASALSKQAPLIAAAGFLLRRRCEPRGRCRPLPLEPRRRAAVVELDLDLQSR